MTGKKFLVSGFSFVYMDEAVQAKKEVEGVAFMHGQADMANPQRMLQIYDKIIDESLFQTVVGYTYLKRLQNYLLKSPEIDNVQVRPIPVTHGAVEDQIVRERVAVQEERQAKQRAVVRANGRMRKNLRISLGCNIILAICVIAMFVLTLSSKSATVLNYERELVDRYAAWEQELTEREQAVREKEAALSMER